MEIEQKLRLLSMAYAITKERMAGPTTVEILKTYKELKEAL